MNITLNKVKSIFLFNKFWIITECIQKPESEYSYGINKIRYLPESDNSNTFLKNQVLLIFLFYSNLNH